ncbi:MAG: hypothetical protein KKC79_15575, partial [Gammaproteobacteria bacterium]|nr:hypothetical protein [Gammaproteobacteria bacterium]
VQTGKGSLPTRLALDPDGQRAWVGLDGSDEVLALDLREARIAGRARVGRGLHTLTTAGPGPWLAVTSADSDTVSFVDRSTLKTVAEVRVGATPVAAAWSAAAQRLAVLSINGGGLALIDPTTKRVTGTVPMARGALALGLFDDGRRAMVLNGRDDTLTLLDLATAQAVATRKLPARPDQIAFSRDFAYVRSQTTPQMQVIALAQARDGRLDGVAVPMGRSAPEAAPEALNVADVLAPAPEGNGVLLANPADGSIYRYVQGLMVPVNTHSNYRRRARGLLVLDSSLAERGPGRFEAPAHFRQGGRYDVVVRNLRPAITACFTIAVEGTMAPVALPVAPKPRLVATRALAHDTVEVEFMLAESADRPARTDDVVLLLVQRAGVWQGRTRAAPLGDGRYRARLRGLPPGAFEAMVEAPALAIAFSDGRLGRLQWPLAEGRAP